MMFQRKSTDTFSGKGEVQGLECLSNTSCTRRKFNRARVESKLGKTETFPGKIQAWEHVTTKECDEAVSE